MHDVVFWMSHVSTARSICGSLSSFPHMWLRSKINAVDCTVAALHLTHMCTRLHGFQVMLILRPAYVVSAFTDL